MFTKVIKYFIVKNIALFLLVFFPVFVSAQTISGKVKGNKIVELKTQKVAEFNSIEVGNSFEVVLVLKPTPSVSVDADSNLHKHISVKVTDGKLIIGSDKVFTRYKRLFVEVGINSKLTDIFVKNKASLTTKNILIPERLTIETYDTSKANLKLKTANASFFAKGKSKITASGESEVLSISVNDNSSVEANVICKNFSASQNLRSELVLSGKTESSIFQITEDSFFNGANFVSGTAILSISGNADGYLSVADKITLEATGKANMYILGNSLVDLKVFKDEATLHKTNKAPSTIKSFLK